MLGTLTELGYEEPTPIQRAAIPEMVAGHDLLGKAATGTGKTSIAFQIAWKLFQSRWNLTREPTRRPRILFLAEANRGGGEKTKEPKAAKSTTKAAGTRSSSAKGERTQAEIDAADKAKFEKTRKL